MTYMEMKYSQQLTYGEIILRHPGVDSIETKNREPHVAYFLDHQLLLLCTRVCLGRDVCVCL